MGKIRADELVMKLGLCESRTQAQACILAGQIRLGTEKIDKASKMISQDSLLSLDRPPALCRSWWTQTRKFFQKPPLAY